MEPPSSAAPTAACLMQPSTSWYPPGSQGTIISWVTATMTFLVFLTWFNERQHQSFSPLSTVLTPEYFWKRKYGFFVVVVLFNYETDKRKEFSLPLLIFLFRSKVTLGQVRVSGAWCRPSEGQLCSSKGHLLGILRALA